MGHPKIGAARLCIALGAVSLSQQLFRLFLARFSAENKTLWIIMTPGMAVLGTTGNKDISEFAFIIFFNLAIYAIWYLWFHLASGQNR